MKKTGCSCRPWRRRVRHSAHRPEPIAQRPKPSAHLHQGRGAHPPALLSELPSPRLIGPMSLLTYEDARPGCRSIKTRVSQRQMPPWRGPERRLDSQIQGRRSLTDKGNRDARVVGGWRGAQGSLADMPPRAFRRRRRWHIGKPDLVVSIPNPQTITAAGADWWTDIIADSGLTEDRYQGD